MQSSAIDNYAILVYRALSVFHIPPLKRVSVTMTINLSFMRTPRFLKGAACFWLLAALPTFTWILSDEIGDFRKELPSVVTISFSDFSGRVMPYNNVHFGTSFIVVPADQINGEDAIASYRLFKSKDDIRCLEITYWKPDPKTSNVFQRATLTKTPGDFWKDQYVTISSCELDGKAMFLYPEKTTGRFTWDIVLLSLVAILFSIAAPALLWMIGADMAQKRKQE